MRDKAKLEIGIFMDGDKYCAVINDHFTNIQEDCAGFSDNIPDAIILLINQLKDSDSDLLKWEKKESHDVAEPYKTDSVICLSCLRDWQAVYPANLEINNLDCPDCGRNEAVEFNVINSRKIIEILEDMFLSGGDFERIIKEFKK